MASRSAADERWESRRVGANCYARTTNATVVAQNCSVVSGLVTRIRQRRRFGEWPTIGSIDRRKRRLEAEAKPTKRRKKRQDRG